MADVFALSGPAFGPLAGANPTFNPMADYLDIVKGLHR